MANAYTVLRHGDRHAVVTCRGDVVRTHTTRAAALAHVAALIEKGCHMGDVLERAQATAGPCVRSFAFEDFELRDGGTDGYTFEGVASVVDTPYTVRDPWGEFTETIKAGAFNKTLRDGANDIALFVNHDYRALPLATRADGSLRLTADPHLRVVARLDPDRPSVREVASAVRNGQARQMSIGFTVPKSRDKWNDEMTERVIAEVALTETSIVWRGANGATSGAMRALDEILALRLDDMTEDEVQRAIAHLSELLPAPSPVDVRTGAYDGTSGTIGTVTYYTTTTTAGAAVAAATAPAAPASEQPAGLRVTPELLALWNARKGAD